MFDAARPFHLSALLGLVLFAFVSVLPSCTADPAPTPLPGSHLRARVEARIDGDFKAADAIRDELAEKGIALEDGPGGTRWKVVG